MAHVRLQPPERVATNRPIAIDLFSGAGGMSLAFEQAGFDVVAALEADPAHAAAHGFNFPWCEVVQADARTASGGQLRAAAAKGLKDLGRSATEASQIDVVFGGPPCQGFSVGGLMHPDDPRNDLVLHFMRLVTELRPSAFVVENVPAMASRALPNDDVPVPERLRLEMDRQGYDTVPASVFNASWFGVPQDRRRLIVVGSDDRSRFRFYLSCRRSRARNRRRHVLDRGNGVTTRRQIFRSVRRSAKPSGTFPISTRSLHCFPMMQSACRQNTDCSSAV